MAQSLQSLSYKECSVILPKFKIFGLFTLILGTPTIMDQVSCCYAVTTSEIGLHRGDGVARLYEGSHGNLD